LAAVCPLLHYLAEEMADLDKEIADLEARVGKYEAEYDAATTPEEKVRISGLINTRTETLNRLMDEKKMAFHRSEPVSTTGKVNCAASPL